MYRAKENGRSQAQLFVRSDRPSLVDGLRFRHELHEALARNQFELYYQPIVCVSTGQIVAVEALVRWHHPQRKVLLPGEFLGVMEENGLIIPLGRWVLEEAIRQRLAWEDERQPCESDVGPLRVNVNLSPRQLAEPSFANQMAEFLESSAIDPDWINLEITEGALAMDIESTVQVLRDLRLLGLHLWVDDFGAGFASLGYLSSFPVEALKIDRRFTSGLGTRPEDETIVESVVMLAGKLGLTCIAEGVETEDQLRRLRGVGCEQAQGFLLGVPLPASALDNPPSSDLSSWNVESPNRWRAGAPSVS
jgi:EAL domain-containing protein (putative c-di-GMP-specific phosphodiesterase class I)